MNPARPVFVVLTAFAIALCAPATSEAFTSLVVSAGDFDRHNVAVAVNLDGSLRNSTWWLVGDSGSRLILQRADALHGVFILPDLKADESRTFQLLQRLIPQERARGA